MKSGVRQLRFVVPVQLGVPLLVAQVRRSHGDADALVPIAFDVAPRLVKVVYATGGVRQAAVEEHPVVVAPKGAHRRLDGQAPAPTGSHVDVVPAKGMQKNRCGISTPHFIESTTRVVPGSLGRQRWCALGSRLGVLLGGWWRGRCLRLLLAVVRQSHGSATRWTHLERAEAEEGRPAALHFEQWRPLRYLGRLYHAK